MKLHHEPGTSLILADDPKRADGNYNRSIVAKTIHQGRSAPRTAARELAKELVTRYNQHDEMKARIAELEALIGQVSRMRTTQEADGQDMDNDLAMNGLIARCRDLVDAMKPRHWTVIIDLKDGSGTTWTTIEEADDAQEAADQARKRYAEGYLMMQGGIVPEEHGVDTVEEAILQQAMEYDVIAVFAGAHTNTYI